MLPRLNWGSAYCRTCGMEAERAKIQGGCLPARNQLQLESAFSKAKHIFKEAFPAHRSLFGSPGF